MHFVADDDREGWGAKQAVAFDVPAGAFEQRRGGRRRAPVKLPSSRRSTRAPPQPAGSPRMSRAHSSATSSNAAAAGDITRREAF